MMYPYLDKKAACGKKVQQNLCVTEMQQFHNKAITHLSF